MTLVSDDRAASDAALGERSMGFRSIGRSLGSDLREGPERSLAYDVADPLPPQEFQQSSEPRFIYEKDGLPQVLYAPLFDKSRIAIRLSGIHGRIPVDESSDSPGLSSIRAVHIPRHEVSACRPAPLSSSPSNRLLLSHAFGQLNEGHGVSTGRSAKVNLLQTPRFITHRQYRGE